jgi:multidrug efflux pump subunit AcrA (membrane-fusion protein)
VFARGGLTGLFVADDGTARLRWVALGARSGDSVEIRAGIEVGEHVILDPTGLVEGAPIRETLSTDVAGSGPAEER